MKVLSVEAKLLLASRVLRQAADSRTSPGHRSIRPGGGGRTAAGAIVFFFFCFVLFCVLVWALTLACSTGAQQGRSTAPELDNHQQQQPSSGDGRAFWASDTRVPADRRGRHSRETFSGRGPRLCCSRAFKQEGEARPQHVGPFVSGVCLTG